MGPLDEHLIPTLCDEIRFKHVLVEKNPFYHLKRDRIVKHADSMNNLYSWWIEHPDVRQMIMSAPKGSRIIANLKHSASEGAERLSGAWNYVNSATKDLQHDLDHKTLINIARIVDENNDYYRKGEVDIRWMELCPDTPTKIEGVMSDVFERLSRKEDPIEAAIYAHLMIAAVQPFKDGNKRTARLVQSKILRDQGLPPIVIPPGEREHYSEVLYGAVKASGLQRTESGHYNLHGPANLKAQRPFYTYMAGQLNSLFDEILGDLKVPYRRNGKNGNGHNGKTS